MSERGTIERDGVVVPVPMAAATTLEAGRIAAVNAAGNALAAADTAGLKVVGMINQTVDNSTGAIGDKSVLVKRNIAVWLSNSATNPVTKAHLHGLAIIYIEDDETVSSATGTNSIVAGRGLEVSTTYGVLVELPQ